MCDKEFFMGYAEEEVFFLGFKPIGERFEGKNGHRQGNRVGGMTASQFRRMEQDRSKSKNHVANPFNALASQEIHKLNLQYLADQGIKVRKGTSAATVSQKVRDHRIRAFKEKGIITGDQMKEASKANRAAGGETHRIGRTLLNIEKLQGKQENAAMEAAIAKDKSASATGKVVEDLMGISNRTRRTSKLSKDMTKLNNISKTSTEMLNKSAASKGSTDADKALMSEINKATKSAKKKGTINENAMPIIGKPSKTELNAFANAKGNAGGTELAQATKRKKPRKSRKTKASAVSKAAGEATTVADKGLAGAGVSRIGGANVTQVSPGVYKPV